jgi:eukaryotic-like serine/threonine-protein kinase
MGTVSPVPPARPAAVERFQLLEQLGAGGHGTVHRARDTALGIEVAIKVLARTEGLDVFRFKREFRAFSGVLHPNLVRLYELFADDAQWCFSMELVRGAPFDQYVRPAGRLDPARLRNALYQAADVLSAIHRLGKVHRDIKPSNILVEESGRVVVLDYGLVTDVRAGGPERTHDTAAVGTPAYMSPEQALDEPLGPASDWYSLGVMLYEALAGGRPFEGPVHAMVSRRVLEAPAPPRAHDPGVDPGLEALCLALLRREPAARGDAREVMAALGRAPSAATLAVEQTAAPLPFVGRARELAVLRDAFDEARRGGSVQVLVTGPSGIGKTALIQAFLDGLGETALVLRGRCYERETVPCQAIDGLVDALTSALLLLPAGSLDAPLPSEVAVLARRFPALARVPAIARARVLLPPDPGEQRRRALRAFAELVWRLAGRRTPVFFVDDLQWSDEDSAGALADVLRHLAAVGALFVASCRDTGGAPRPPERGIELPLAPLSAEDAAGLAGAVLAGDPQADELSAELARDSAGVPVFLVELARAAGRRSDPSGSSPALDLALAGGPPVTLEQLLDERLRALPPDTRALLEVCAVAARPLALEVAAAAAPCDDPVAALSRLRAERLLRAAPHGAELRIEPYHDRIRDAVTAPLSPDAVRGIYGRLAAALDGRAGTTAAQLVAYRLAAGDAERARALARTAAADAEAAFAFHRAADLYRLALEAADLPAAERRALTLRRIECLAGAGRPVEVIEVAAAAAEEGAERRELKRLEIESRLRCRDFAGGVAESRALLAELGVHLPTGRTAILAALFTGRLRLRLRGLSFKRRAPAELPAETLERIDLVWALTIGLNYVSPVLSALVHTHHLRAALAAGEPGRVARALCGELPRLAIGDRGGRRLAAMTERIQALAAEVELPEVTAMLETTLCFTSYLVGRWHAAAVHGARAEQLIRDHVRRRWLLSVIHIHHVHARWYLGETGWVVEHMPGFLAEAEEHGDLHIRELLGGAGTNVYWLILGRPDEARAMAPDPRPSRDGAAPFHIRDYDRLQSNAHADLYEDAGRAALDRIEQAWPAFRRSLLWRYRPIRIEGLSLRARGAVAAAAAAGSAVERTRLLALARQAAGQLAAEPLPWAHAFAAAARAGAAHVADPRDPGLPALLDAAAAAATAADMHILVRTAHHRRGTWCREPALAADVEAALRQERIADPAAIVRMLVPG